MSESDVNLSKSCGLCEDILSPRRSYPTCSVCCLTYHFKCVKNTYQSSWKRLPEAAKKSYKGSICEDSSSINRTRSNSISSKNSKRSRDTSEDSEDSIKQRRLEMGSTQRLSVEDKNDIIGGIADLLSAKFERFERKIETKIESEIQKATQQLMEDTKSEIAYLQANNAALTEEVKSLKSRIDSLQN